MTDGEAPDAQASSGGNDASSDGTGPVDATGTMQDATASDTSTGSSPDAESAEPDGAVDATADASARDAALADASPRDAAVEDAVADAATDPCQGGSVGTASDATGSKTPVNGYGSVDLNVSASNQIVSFRMTMAVPPEPPANGTLFLWPGLQPGDGANFAVLDNGVLQPVLTWGPTCAPTAPNKAYASWWISAQYVNTFITMANANYAAYSGCHGGSGISVNVGDSLAISMDLHGTDWVQTVEDPNTGKTATYTLDMLGQAQAWAEWVIEQYSRPPVADVVFTSNVVTFANPEAKACQPTSRGQNDYFAAPRSSPDGRTCCISRVILRAQGVAATTPNGP
jgi:hypothetical protein